MKTSTVFITKEIAEHLLKYNNSNRALRRRTVGYFANCLKSGSFYTTHQGIAIAGTMGDPVRLYDGQHRLAAIVETGISTCLQVTEEASVQCFENADNGLPRSIADRASIRSKEASVCSVVYELCTHGAQYCKAPVDKIKAIYQIIQPHLANVPMPGIRGLSLSAFTTAFLLQQKLTGENDAGLFMSMHTDKSSELAIKNPLLFSIKVRQSQHITRRSYTQAEAFCLIWDCIDGQSRKMIRVRTDAKDHAIVAIRNNWRELYLCAKS